LTLILPRNIKIKILKFLSVVDLLDKIGQQITEIFLT
jgi:hypothetical protein